MCRSPSLPRATAEFIGPPADRASQVELNDAEELLAVTRPYFNDAPTGEIFADRAVAVTVAPYKGTKYFPVMNELQNALVRADVTKTQSAEESWEQFVKDVAALG